MGLHLKFVSHSVPIASSNRMDQWKEYYRPNWSLMIHITLAFLVFLYAQKIFGPSVLSIYNERSKFARLFFLKEEDDSAFVTMDSITEMFIKFEANLQTLLLDSFGRLSFQSDLQAFKYTVTMKNGTILVYPYFRPEKKSFQHINSIQLSTRLLSISSTTLITGCTSWNIDLKVSSSVSGNSIRPLSSFSYDRCPQGYIREQNTKKYAKQSYPRPTRRGIRLRYQPHRRDETLRMIDRVKNHILIGDLSSAVIPSPPSAPIVLYRNNLTVYSVLVRYTLHFLFLSFISLILTIRTLVQQFANHLVLRKTDFAYRELSQFDQFHQTIGFWKVLFLIKYLVLVSSSLMWLFETRYITQFPSRASFVMFGISAFFVVITLLRWLSRWPRVYRVTMILRFAWKRLFSLILGQAPLFCSMIFVSVFLFGYSSQIAESTVNIFEALISLMFGDHIYGLFDEYTNHSEAYNIVTFIFVSSCTAVLIWLFYTSFQASMTFVDHRYISKITGD